MTPVPSCSICLHIKRSEIEKALIAGESERSIAKRFGASASAIHRHKVEHRAETVKRAERKHGAQPATRPEATE